MNRNQFQGYQAAMPLDWAQLRVLLWEVDDCFNKSEQSWDSVARFVNTRCEKSEKRSPAELQRVIDRLKTLYVDGNQAPSQVGLGAQVWAKLLYESAQKLFEGSEFMNLGFVTDKPVQLKPEDEPNRLFIQLYEAALDKVDLARKQVLEIGCGGGGGAHYLAKNHQPDSMVGIDLVEANLDVCNKYESPNLSFRCCDAHQLAFDQDHFDVVINVESSHSYADFELFVSEVERVLRPGGTFVMTDLRPVSAEWGEDKTWSSVERVIETSRLELVSDVDITSNVLEAMKFADEAKKELFASDLFNPAERVHFSEILLCEGSENHRRLASGEWTYRSMTLKAPKAH